MSANYSPLPTTTNVHHPPSSHAILSKLTSNAPPTRVRRLIVFAAVLISSSVLLVYLLYSPSISSPFNSPIFSSTQRQQTQQVAPNDGGYSDVNLADDPSSPWFRDPHPALHARLFLARAQAEIKSRGLDTCNGKLSGKMVDGYIDAAMSYCEPKAQTQDASVTCFPVRAANSPNAWWPYTQSFCASQNLMHNAGWGSDNLRERGDFIGNCTITEAGHALKKAMGREKFLGAEFTEASAGAPPSCGETITHPVLFVPRQDRWNPFHVGEDLVTTFLALSIFSRHSAPKASSLWKDLPEAYASDNAKFTQLRATLETELESTAGLQLIFQDEYLPTQSLFAPLYDRIGAWTARRQAAEALGVSGSPTCFTNAMHSVGAGASLLSGTGVGHNFDCASELVWGASLWLRWMWGLEKTVPGGAFLQGLAKREALEPRLPLQGTFSGAEPVQVLFLSRDKFDAYTRHKNAQLTAWQNARHIDNERDLLIGLRKGLAELCRTTTDIPGATSPDHAAGNIDCTYTDADMLPGSWGVPMHRREAKALGLSHDLTPAPDHSHYPERRRPRSVLSERAASGARALRFATLDPTTLALPAQLGMVGRADVVISVHAGALGLTLFIPTGRSSVIELVPTGAYGNQHFHNMAHMMGNEYVQIGVQRNVDVQKVVNSVKEVVQRRLQA
ncbi:hypothetical protein MIND_00282600 [Mycena indigotica]|uniref:Uncharacterized protein n=1 Tax=Mycena indigotica TaxID=2126181 RepID=A0A8H6T993_9AGAR|nr:uncharacterized protein MIND_00282600 [Mycena indigotica]KAF7312682.1 hypothetical protein MIND_00282600 [Mycena indigotica]